MMMHENILVPCDDVEKAYGQKLSLLEKDAPCNCTLMSPEVKQLKSLSTLATIVAVRRLWPNSTTIVASVDRA